MSRRRFEHVVLLATLLATSLHGVRSASSDHVTPLTKSTFDNTIKKLPASDYAVLDFFASWCPACRHFAPDYEKVAKFLSDAKNGIPSFSVDCADEVELCNAFKISSFPTVFVGRASDYVSRNLTALSTYPAQPRTPDSVVKWLGQKTGNDWDYNQPDAAAAGRKASPSPTPAQEGDALTGSQQQLAEPPVALEWSMSDAQEATVQLYHTIATTAAMHDGSAKRQALTVLLKMWETAHPVDGCRTGASQASKELDTLWPPNARMPQKPLTDLQVCGAGAAAIHGWDACRADAQHARGFTCGLWTLFHTTAARLQTPEHASLFMEHLRHFAAHFFQCSTCRTHFIELLRQKPALEVATADAAILWLWRAHNKVNRRVAVEEASRNGEHQWPPLRLCGDCQLPSSRDAGAVVAYQPRWNMTRVAQFLRQYYGPEGPTQQRVNHQLAAQQDQFLVPQRGGSVGNAQPLPLQETRKALIDRGGRSWGVGAGVFDDGQLSGVHENSYDLGLAVLCLLGGVLLLAVYLWTVQRQNLQLPGRHVKLRTSQTS